MVKRIVFAVLVALLLQHSLQAQEARVAASVDRSEISIGDWIALHLEVTGPADLSVAWPAFREELKGFEIIKSGTPVVTTGSNGSKTSLDLTLTSFEEGKYTIPALEIGYSTKKDPAQKSLTTAPISVTVRGIPVDTAKDIKDIKAPWKMPLGWREVLPYVLAVAAGALLIWLGVFLWRKRKRGEPILPQAPPRPAHEVALEALRLLDAEKLWQQGREKEYHARISDILRTYLEGTMSMPAMEMTTTLIFASGPVAALEEEMRSRLRAILERADLVKFAKFRPLPQEHADSMESAVWFVQRMQQSLDKPAQEAGAA